MIENPSQNLQAVITLTHAQRHVEQRFDNAWWQLDILIWTLVPGLSSLEHEFAINFLNIRNQRRAEMIRAMLDCLPA